MSFKVEKLKSRFSLLCLFDARGFSGNGQPCLKAKFLRLKPPFSALSILLNFFAYCCMLLHTFAASSTDSQILTHFGIWKLLSYVLCRCHETGLIPILFKFGLQNWIDNPNPISNFEYWLSITMQSNKLVSNPSIKSSEQPVNGVHGSKLLAKLLLGYKVK